MYMMRNVRKTRKQSIERKTGIFQKQRSVTNNKKGAVEYFRITTKE